MRIAFLSDLHGNIHALTAVKRFLNEQIVNQVVVVGDLVGYGASPGPVIDFVQREGWPTGMGSSDLRVSLDFGEREGRRGVADQVLELAEDHAAALIVLAVRRRSPLMKLFLGSSAQRILLEASCPVLTLR